MSRIEETFANDIRAALEQRSTRSAWPILLMIGAILSLGGLWAHFAVLDEVARGDGRIIPSRQTQVVQSLDGGIINEIYVSEGETVAEGQPLFLIDDTLAQSEFGEINQKLVALRAKHARLTAEAGGQEFDVSELTLPGDLALQERALFEARRRSLERSLTVIDEQISQRALERDEADTKLATTKKTIETFERELSLARRLRASGAYPELEYLRLSRQAQVEYRERDVLRASLPRIDAAISEAIARREATISEFQAKAREELSAAESEIRVLEQRVDRLDDKVRRTTLRSPVNGVINTLPVTTIGAVVRPAETIAEIVPLDDRLLIEARVSPQDIAFLHPGQRARVKVTAYDYTVYGDLPGELIRVGADSITDDQGQVFYRAIVETDRTHLGVKKEDLPIIPGMVVSVDILTGEKSVLEYLLTPVRRVQAEALRER